MAAAHDPDVWDYAMAHGFVLVSKDTDFQQRALLSGHPPKVIWVRSGNGPTAAVGWLGSVREPRRGRDRGPRTDLSHPITRTSGVVH